MSGTLAHDVFSSYAKSLIQFKARQICSRYGFSRSDQEDLEQEMWLYLAAQAKHFDPKRASVNTFIACALGSCVAMMFRARRRMKRAAGFLADSLESTMIEVDGRPTPARQVVSADDLQRRTGASPLNESDREEEAAAVAHALRSMPTELRRVCRKLMRGTITSTARDLGMSRYQVHGAMRAIRCHLLQAGLGEN